jgi:hypothetical protein
VNCWFAALGNCSPGRLQRAHLIPKQRLKRHVEDVWQPVLWVPACDSHHHKFDKHFILLQEEDYPQGLREWAAANGWVWINPTRGWRHVVACA